MSIVIAYLAWSASETWQDAPFSIDKASLEKAIECPRGISGALGGIVLLVPGTTASGADEWPGTPYWEYLPYDGPQYDVCWFNNPSKGLADAQLSAEYFAYNVPSLAKKSATGKIAVIGHSQGGITPQWALSFWPSIRKYISANIMIAAPIHGINGLPDTMCKAKGMTDCFPSFYQMHSGSAYLLAQHDHALVPSTSIWSTNDGTIIPADSSHMEGAANLVIQQSEICGSEASVDHLQIAVNPGVYALILDALTHNGYASSARFDAKKSCYGFSNTTYPESYFKETVERFSRIVNTPSASTSYQAVGYALTNVEPPLKAYVCKQGRATVCGSF